MNKLKPCPFCGSKAELWHTEKDSEYGKTAFVYCTNCGANGKMIEISPKYGADERAIEAWNRRVNEDAPTVDAVPWMWLEVFAKTKPFDSVDEFIAEAKEMNRKMYSHCCAEGERRE